jgi:transposase
MKMANNPIDMSKVRKVLMMHFQGKSKKFISKYLSLSRNTVKKYITTSQLLGLNENFISSKTDRELEAIFVKDNDLKVCDKLQQAHEFFPFMERELKKVGVTKYQLWQKYLERHPEGYRSSQFMEYYRRWSMKVNPVMHMEHKAGDKMFVDYAGKKLQVIDRQSGEVQDVEFYVAILGASQYTYAEASMSQKKEDFIKSTENALLFYGGVPAAIVPDNLKSAVTKSSRIEPQLNKDFEDFAEHYGTTILPARAYKPKDKALAEGAVKILYQRIYSQLHNQEFYSLKDLNKAIWILLSKHNKALLTGRPYSRLNLFKELEEKELSELAIERFEIREIEHGTVIKNAHVMLKKDKHYYSVPYQYIQKKVKIEYTSDTVVIHCKYNRIATHKRSYKPHSYTTLPEHLPSTHRFLSDWNPQKFINWANNIDPQVGKFITFLLENKQHPEQAYKSCIGVLSMEKKVGKERLINACKRALEFGIYNYKIIENILSRGLDKYTDEQDNDKKLPPHNNIRGEDYYQ